jgi:hypothetical protein
MAYLWVWYDYQNKQQLEALTNWSYKWRYIDFFEEGTEFFK